MKIKILTSISILCCSAALASVKDSDGRRSQQLNDQANKRGKEEVARRDAEWESMKKNQEQADFDRAIREGRY